MSADETKTGVSLGGEDEYYDSDWWGWGILFGLFMLGTGIYNFGWQIFAAIGAALVGTALLVWAGVALVRIYLASEFHLLRKVLREDNRDFRRIARQIRKLRTKTRPKGR